MNCKRYVTPVGLMRWAALVAATLAAWLPCAAALAGKAQDEPTPSPWRVAEVARMNGAPAPAGADSKSCIGNIKSTAPYLRIALTFEGPLDEKFDKTTSAKGSIFAFDDVRVTKVHHLWLALADGTRIAADAGYYRVKPGTRVFYVAWPRLRHRVASQNAAPAEGCVDADADAKAAAEAEQQRPALERQRAALEKRPNRGAEENKRLEDLRQRLKNLEQGVIDEREMTMPEITRTLIIEEGNRFAALRVGAAGVEGEKSADGNDKVKPPADVLTAAAPSPAPATPVGPAAPPVATNTPAAPVAHASSDPERLATARLNMAKALEDASEVEKAMRYYRDIVEKYPGTAAAAEAAKRLARPN